ncbi:MAG: zinc ribbon domain-containing protein [Pseudomonadota bacterium]
MTGPLLNRTVYAGMVEALSWDVSILKGQHEGLISLSTYHKIQERLNGKPKAPLRKDINADFPLRGFVLCAECEKPLTACWSKSRTGRKHAYYWCKTKGCSQHRKSIRRDALEQDFEKLLNHAQPDKELFDVWAGMVATT